MVLILRKELFANDTV